MLEKVTPKPFAPLPRNIDRLLVCSAVLSTTAFILSMTHSFGYDSLWTVPAGWLLTIVHHATIFVLSRRRRGPPPLPPLDETSPIKNKSRVSVYHPASKVSSETAFSAVSESEHPEQHQQDTHHNATSSVTSLSGGAHNTTEYSDSRYPPFTRTTANCVATCVLAVIWTVGAVLPIRNHVVDMSTVAYFFRNFFPLPEAGVMWALFVLFVRARSASMKEGQFMRMDNC